MLNLWKSCASLIDNVSDCDQTVKVMNLVFMYLFIACVPCALVPAVPDLLLNLFEIFAPNLVLYTVLCVLIYFTLNLAYVCSSNIYFFPLNVRLNTTKRHKNSFTIDNCIIHCCYIIFSIFLILEEQASAILLLRHAMLDCHCFNLLCCVTGLNILVLRLGARSIVYTVVNHKKIFHPWFCNSELTTLWVVALLLKLSSDVHSNSGSPPDNFSNAVLSFCVSNYRMCFPICSSIQVTC